MKTKIIRNLLKHFEKIEDYRTDKHKIQYPLNEIIVLTILAIAKQKTKYSHMRDYIEFLFTKKLIKKLFKMETIPSTSQYYKILVNIDNNSLENLFREYFEKYSDKKELAIDGKILKGSSFQGLYKTKEKNKAILNTICKKNKIVLSHIFLETKTTTNRALVSEQKGFLNELVSNSLFSKGNQIFTFDGLHNRQEILEQIENNNNYFIIKHKDTSNRMLVKNLKNLIKNYKPNKNIKDDGVINGNKIITRYIDLYNDEHLLKDFNKTHNLPEIKTVVIIKREIYDPKTKQTTINFNYLFSNGDFKIDEIYLASKNQWLIETYHYHLDTFLEEDEHIAHINPFSISILRSFTLNLYQLLANKNNKKLLFYKNLFRSYEMETILNEFSTL